MSYVAYKYWVIVEVQRSFGLAQYWSKYLVIWGLGDETESEIWSLYLDIVYH